ncbi:MAG: amidohydrolase [Anaerolineaceae bacterium]|nr:amidohydrolase [Anaerolineaceae bacterium]
MSSIKGLEYKGVPIWERVTQKELREKPWKVSDWQTQLRKGEALKDLLIIDGHAHLGEYAGFLIHKPHAASMVEVMDKIGMQAAIISSNAAIRSNPAYGNKETLQAVRDFPGRLFGYVTANPYYAENFKVELNHYLDQPGFVAIKLHPEMHDNYPLRGPRYEPMWKIAAERKVPVLFHTYFGGDSLEDIAWLANRYPHIPLLVGHQLQDKNMEAMAELANTFENIYVDLTVPEIYGSVEFFVAAVDNIEQIIFGTDFPWGNCHFRVGAVIYARISDEEKRLILGKNAAKLFGLRF